MSLAKIWGDFPAKKENMESIGKWPTIFIILSHEPEEIRDCQCYGPIIITSVTYCYKLCQNLVA